jgi:hypothetical protein
VDEERGTPITPVLPGGRLHNTYRGQLDEDGGVPLPGRRWAGGDVDVTRPLPSDLVLEAIAAEPSLMRVAGPYKAMEVLPAALAEIEPQAREIFASGWRPEPHPGPSRDELADLVMGARL